ncbi:YbbR-like [Moorella glycerini]|uniref:YbbR-like protein n=1 Tax=Neomoorella stamsii TaxID=1266720 RepID=A0A9X7J3D6_9FIRM|nr:MULTISPECIES: CdaR family protein [Moorella]PRR73535.1 YbbR-like protein [Moorella stamsii]CEP69304.1 YbbR-like [Moorella glycerini]
MREHFRQDWIYRLLAVALAIILWMYVTGEQNPTGEKVVRVPLETENLREGLVVADRPAEVQVRVEGRKAAVNTLLSRDVHAFVSLREAKVGDNLLPVRVEVPEGINVIHVNPSQVTIKLDKIEQVQLPVQVNLLGTPVSGYRALEPVIKPSQVVVSGSAETLKSIGRVYVEAKIDQASGNFLAQLPVKLADREGRPLQEWLTVSPEVVETFVPVVQDMPSKFLAVRPQLAGEPAKGYAVQRVILQPEVVEVFAPYNHLAALDYINTAPINIAGAMKNVTAETNLEIPAGVQVSSFPRVRVVVEIGKAANPASTP